MKEKVIFLAVLVTLVVVGAGVKLFFDVQNQTTGKIVITSVPDATVFIDSQAYTKTPAHFSLPPGEYSIKLIPIVHDAESTASARVSWQGTVRVTRNTTVQVQRELSSTENESSGEIVSIARPEQNPLAGRGEIKVLTEPFGAKVSLDNEDIAVSPHVIANVVPGIHEVSVSLPRFKRRSVQVRVYPGYQTVVDFQLGLDQQFETRLGLVTVPTAGASSSSLPIIPTAEPTQVRPKKVEILDTPTGFLRVRSEPNLAGREITRVKPGEKYDYLDERRTWIKIKLDLGEGWVSGEYVRKE
jgi:hypothetical protein